MPARSPDLCLHTSSDWTGSHQALYLPWLREHAVSMVNEARPAPIVVPARGDAYFLKSLALGAGLNLFGLHFLTPLEMRDHLRRVYGRSHALPLREHLR